MARPTKYNPTVVRAICRSLENGAPRMDAAGAAGISYETFRQWLARHLEFRAAVEKAEATMVTANVRIVKAAASKSWQAAAWLLERRRPEDFGRRDRLDVLIEREAQAVADQLGISLDEVMKRATEGF